MSAPIPPASLVAQHVSVSRRDRPVLARISLTVSPGDRIGVVGPNGVGKSTLLAVLAGELEPDEGTVRRDPPGATVGLLTQEHRHDADETVRDLLLRRTGVRAAEAELQAAATALGTPRGDARYALALERLVALSDGDVDARMETVLEGFGVGQLIDRPSSPLSGGQAAKVALAAVALARHDILLLDEPTNDLDFDGLTTLSTLIAQRPGGVVVVSHDRDFLARTIDSVLEIDEHTHSGKHFSGGWAAYLGQRATDRRHAEEAYRVYDSKKSDLTARARREREWATRGVGRERKRRDNDKAQRDFRINRTEQLASRARRTERALRSLDAVEKPWEGWNLRMAIGHAPRAGAIVSRLTRAVIERGRFRLGPIDLEIGWGERVALVGPNGSGKSSLVEAIVGRLPLAAGERWLGPSVVVGELGQDRTGSGAPGASVLDRTVERCGLTVTEARALLAKFGIGAEEVARPARSLSPGERTRAELAAFQGAGVNFLVLDEPTNHLDLPAIEQLEAALEGFEGTLLLVSHDRALLAAVDVTRTIDLPALVAAAPRGAHTPSGSAGL